MDLLIKAYPPPPPRITGGNFSAACTPHAPSTLLGPAYDVIWTIPAPFGATSQWPRPRGTKGAHLKEETKLNNFLLYSFLIGDLGAEQLAPKDRQKFSKYTRPPKFLRSAQILDCRVNFGLSGRYNQPVQYGKECANKSSVQAVHLPLGVYMSERQHIYEDLNESSSARPGGSQQQEIQPSLNSNAA